MGASRHRRGDRRGAFHRQRRHAYPTSRNIALLCLLLLLVGSCGSNGMDERRSPVSRPSRHVVPLGQSGRLGAWEISVLRSTLEPKGASAQDPVLPSWRDTSRPGPFTALVLITRVGSDVGDPWAELSFDSTSRTGRRYSLNRGPACKHRRPHSARVSPGHTVRATLCFSVPPDDIDHLMLFARLRDGHDAQAFHLQSTSH